MAPPTPASRTVGVATVAARKALEAASRAFGEIRYRRTGLLVALAVILLAVVALLLKIRDIDARRTTSSRARPRA